MAPWRLPGRLWVAPGGPNGHQGRRVEAQLRRVRSSFFLAPQVRFRRPPGAILAPLGVVLGLPPLPGGLREVILGGFLRRLERGLEKAYF